MQHADVELPSVVKDVRTSEGVGYLCKILRIGPNWQTEEQGVTLCLRSSCRTKSWDSTTARAKSSRSEDPTEECTPADPTPANGSRRIKAIRFAAHARPYSEEDELLGTLSSTLEEDRTLRLQYNTRRCFLPALHARASRLNRAQTFRMTRSVDLGVLRTVKQQDTLLDHNKADEDLLHQAT